MLSFRFLFSVHCLLACLAFSVNAEKLSLKWYYTSEAITGYAEFLKDDTNQYTIEDIKSAELQQAFIPFTANDINQGINKASYWFKFKLYNPKRERHDLGNLPCKQLCRQYGSLG